VRALARLETIQYTVEKVITAETNQGTFGFLFADKLLLVAHGTVIAGVDLGKLKPEDMWLDGSVLNVRLPSAEVFIATLDNDKTYVYERDTGVLRSPDQNLETLARQSAEQEIQKAAIDDGILNIARQNAETYLTRFFLSLGYADVIFVQPTP
jgi:broad specificity phosphatase PhoE